MRELSEDDVISILRIQCRAAGSQKAWADTRGFSAAYVSDILNRRRDPSEAIANSLGLVRKIAFIPVREDQAA